MTGLLASCNKNDDDIQNPDVAGIMAFNLAPDQHQVGFSITGNIFTQVPLDFGNYTVNYRPIYTGNRTISAFNYGNGELLDSANANFENEKYYSTFLFGRDSSYQQVILQDELDSLPFVANKAFVRMVNGYTNNGVTPNIRYSLSDSSEIYNQPLVYTGISSFKEVPVGELTLQAKTATEVISNRTVTIEANKIYTFLLLDAPSGNPMDNPEIKFIVNGIITP